MKVRKSFLLWLKQESARRGLFIYEVVEELASVALAVSGKKSPNVWTLSSRAIAEVAAEVKGESNASPTPVLQNLLAVSKI